MKKGLVYAFTGDGKGKTSAAIGVATRALLINEKVVWVAFYKEESWGMAEKGLREKFPNISMDFVGKGFYIGKKTAPVGNKGHVVVDKATRVEHKDAAKVGLELVREKLKLKPFLIVIDEILNTVHDGLVEESELIKLLDQRQETHIVMTGRYLTGSLLVRCDLVTECKKIKHPYDKGELAIRGLDF